MGSYCKDRGRQFLIGLTGASCSLASSTGSWPERPSAQSEQRVEQNSHQRRGQPKNRDLIMFVPEKPDRTEHQTSRRPKDYGRPAKGQYGRTSARSEQEYDGKAG
jgi:hypothetical protein